MARVFARQALHSWNLAIRHAPSRCIRRLWLRRLLGEMAEEVFVGLNVELLTPRHIHIGQRSVINANCVLDGRGGDLNISSDVDIATHTHIWTLQHDPDDDAHGTQAR